MLHPLGNHRIACLAFLVAVSLCKADWDATDRATLSDINLGLSNAEILLEDQLGGNFGTYGISLADFMEKLNKRMFSPVDIQGVAEYAPPHVSIFSTAGYSPVIEPNQSFDNSSTAQIAVTNISETFWLEKIYDRLETMQASSFGLTLWPSLNADGDVNYYLDMDSAYQDVLSLLSDPDSYSYLWSDYGIWRLFAQMYVSTINPYSSTIYNPELSETLIDLRQKIVGGSDSDTYPFTLAFDAQYGNGTLLSFFKSSGIDTDDFNPTNFFNSDGSIANEDNAFTNSDTSVFAKFSKSFLPSGLFSPEEVNTNLFEYVDSNISGNPTFNPQPLRGGTRSSSRSSASFNYDFDDSNDYSYNVVNPLKTATDVVQGDTDIENKFNILADLVNSRISSIFDSSLDNISQQPSRWSVKFIGKDGSTIEEYVDSKQSDSADGIRFVCWVIESTMFAGFFFTCVRRSLRIGNGGDAST